MKTNYFIRPWFLRSCAWARRGVFLWVTGLTPVKVISLVTLSCFMVSFIFGQAVAEVLQSVRETKQFNGIVSEFDIPSATGRITDARFLGSKGVVINIQDLHCHPEVQKNIGKLLLLLDQKYRLSRVYLEGASGAVDTSWLTSIKNKDLRQKITDALVDEGKLTGAEYYSVQSERPDLIAGIEDEKLYSANLARLGRILDGQEEIDGTLSGIGSSLQRLKESYYNSKQRKLEAITAKYRAEEIDAKKYYLMLGKYCQNLDIDINGYRNITGYLGLMELERSLNYRKTAWELQQFVMLLKQKLPYNAYNLLLKETGNFSQMDKLSLSLLRLSGEYDFNLACNYPGLNTFMRYLKASRKINPIDLVQEEKNLLSEINVRLADNQSEREVAFLAGYFKYLQEYLGNKISADDYACFAANLPYFKTMWVKYINNDSLSRLSPYFNLLAEFYAVNLERNHSFIRNLAAEGLTAAAGGALPAEARSDNEERIFESLQEAGEVKVVITGGFHTPGLKALLEEKGISYLVITPNVTQDTRFSEAVYARLAREQAKMAFQAFALVALSRQPVREKAEAAAAAVLNAYLASSLSREEVINEIRHFQELKIQEETGSGQGRPQTVTFDFDEDSEGKYTVRIHYTDNGGKERIARCAFAVEEGKAKLVESDNTAFTPEARSISARNRAAMAVAAGAAAAAAGALATASLGAGMIGGALAVFPVVFYLVQRYYIRKAGLIRGAPVELTDESDVKSRVEAVLASLPSGLLALIEKTGYVVDVSLPASVPLRYGKEDRKIHINLNSVENLREIAPWMLSTAFSHEARHARWNLPGYLGFIEEFLVSLGDAVDAAVFPVKSRGARRAAAVVLAPRKAAAARETAAAAGAQAPAVNDDSVPGQEQADPVLDGLENTFKKMVEARGKVWEGLSWRFQQLPVVRSIMNGHIAALKTSGGKTYAAIAAAYLKLLELRKTDLKSAVFIASATSALCREGAIEAAIALAGKKLG
ncbi:MAG: hypothetical protein ACYC5N_03060, partial [Endomicrobiales bacterium]